MKKSMRRLRMASMRAFEAMESRLLFSTIYVDASAAGPIHDGATWDAAYLQIQEALAAATSGDEVRVADGTYVPGTAPGDTFRLKNGVELLGGYAGFGAPSPNARDVIANPSVLRGPGGTGYSHYIIVTATAVDATTILDGFTLAPSLPTLYGDSGSGLSCLNASPVVQNCTFTGLTGTGVGVSFSSPTFIDCTFSNNSAGYGGAMGISYSSVTATRCVFIQNRSLTGDGGAIRSINSQLELKNCTFTRNSSRRTYGGAISTSGGTAGVILCIFNGNSASSEGGAIFSDGSLGVSGSAFTGNTAGYTGGAISGGVSVITSSTFTHNVAGYHGGAVYASAPLTDLESSIVWDNTGYVYKNLYLQNPYHIFVNDIQGGGAEFGAEGGIDSDPLFVRVPSTGPDGTWGTTDDDYGDLRLQPYSPCIDVGHIYGPFAAVSQLKDLAGNPRAVDFPGVTGFENNVDMGAYETPVALIVLSTAFAVDGIGPSIRATFNMQVDPFTITRASLSLVNVTTGQVIPLDSGNTTVTYDSPSRTATWCFAPNLLTDGNYRARLPGGAVTSTLGLNLVEGKPFDFFVLGGDANRDRRADVLDLVILANNWQLSGKVFTQGDFNYDGWVNATDLGVLAQHWQMQLSAPPAPAIPTATGARRPPVRTPVRMVGLV